MCQFFSINCKPDQFIKTVLNQEYRISVNISREKMRYRNLIMYVCMWYFIRIQLS